MENIVDKYCRVKKRSKRGKKEEDCVERKEKREKTWNRRFIFNLRQRKKYFVRCLFNFIFVLIIVT